MNDRETIKKLASDNLPPIVNTVCGTIVLLALIYAVYSYLLAQIEIDRKPLAAELQKVQNQLKVEAEKRLAVEQERDTLSTQLKAREADIGKLVELDNKSKAAPLSSEQQPVQICPVETAKMDEDFLGRATRQTLSRKPNERFEGFTLLMNNLDYMDEQAQRDIIEIYLQEIDAHNRDGVYYATFVLSELPAAVLKDYAAELEETFQFMHQSSGWEKTLHNYCKIEGKLNNNLTAGSTAVARQSTSR